MIDLVSARYKGVIPRVKGHPCRIGWTCSGVLTSVRLFCGNRTSTKQNCLIDLTASVMRMVSHLTSYCISSVVTYQLNQSLAQPTMTV